MAPALNHPSGVTFVEEQPTDVDAAIYYGGGDSYTRSRTYSTVRLVFSLLMLTNVHCSLIFMAISQRKPPLLRKTGIFGLVAYPTMKRASLAPGAS